MRIIVIGPSLSGKTTLIRHLRSHISTPISEIDDELSDLNDGTFPSDSEYKHKVLAPKVVKKVLETDDIVFFTNTDYFTFQDLQDAKAKGFKIVLLNASLKTLQARNTYRVEHEGYGDLSQYLEGMLKYAHEVRDIADVVIDVNRPLEAVADDLIKVCS